MQVCTRSSARAAVLAALCLSGGVASAKSALAPFTLVDATAGTSKGLWLADLDHPGLPPTQVTNQVLDGSGALALFNTWTYDSARRASVNVTPALAVYGLGGQLWAVNLTTLGAPRQFSSGSYGELCGLSALDAKSFAATAGYVEAFVEPVGSANTCASGVGIVTWLIRADATAITAPTVQPANWSVLGALTDPNSDAFVRWLVWTGNEVNTATANFATQKTVLVGPPASAVVNLFGRLGGTAILIATVTSGSSSVDTLYRVTSTSGAPIASFTYSTTGPCIGNAGGSVVDGPNGLIAFARATDQGYAVYSMPLAGGAPTQLYADTSGTVCGNVNGDSVSAGHVVVSEGNRVIGLNEFGPATQSPVVLADAGGSGRVVAHYVTAGRVWIDVVPDGAPRSELVIYGDGTGSTTFANSAIGNDLWGGFTFSGAGPGLFRDTVLLFSAAGDCNGGTMAAIDSATLGSTAIAGLPSDACRTVAAGWGPAIFGNVIRASGSNPMEIDPSTGQLLLLLGPDGSGTFTSLTSVNAYPFY